MILNILDVHLELEALLTYITNNIPHYLRQMLYSNFRSDEEFFESLKVTVQEIQKFYDDHDLEILEKISIKTDNDIRDAISYQAMAGFSSIIGLKYPLGGKFLRIDSMATNLAKLFLEHQLENKIVMYSELKKQNPKIVYEILINTVSQKNLAINPRYLLYPGASLIVLLFSMKQSSSVLFNDYLSMKGV